MARDLKADLELCNKAIEEPWEYFEYNPNASGCNGWIGTKHESIVMMVNHGLNGKPDSLDTTRFQFIAESSSGWPEAINRAMRAEELLQKCRDALFSLSTIYIKTSDMGQCRECGQPTSSGMNAYCAKCASKVVREVDTFFKEVQNEPNN